MLPDRTASLGVPSDVVTSEDLHRWNLAVAVAEQLMVSPSGVVSISRIADHAATLAAARVLYRGGIPT